MSIMWQIFVWSAEVSFTLGFLGHIQTMLFVIVLEDINTLSHKPTVSGSVARR